MNFFKTLQTNRVIRIKRVESRNKGCLLHMNGNNTITPWHKQNKQKKSNSKIILNEIPTIQQ